jgi:hypothetical protein
MLEICWVLNKLPNIKILFQCCIWLAFLPNYFIDSLIFHLKLLSFLTFKFLDLTQEFKEDYYITLYVTCYFHTINSLLVTIPFTLLYEGGSLWTIIFYLRKLHYNRGVVCILPGSINGSVVTILEKRPHSQERDGRKNYYNDNDVCEWNA